MRIAPEHPVTSGGVDSGRYETNPGSVGGCQVAGGTARIPTMLGNDCRRTLVMAVLVVLATTGGVGALAGAATTTDTNPSVATADADDEDDCEEGFSFDTVGQEDVLFRPQPNQLITGTVDAQEGTLLTVTVRSTDPGTSFIRSKRTRVDENGTFHVQFDLGALPAGTNVTVTVRHPDGTTLDTVRGEVATFTFEMATDGLAAGPNQSIGGVTSLTPGTNLTFLLRSDIAEDPLLEPRLVEVEDDGTATAEFDLSDLPKGTNLTVEVQTAGGTPLACNDPGKIIGKADIRLEDLESPATVGPGDHFTVTAHVTNVGSKSGTAVVELEVAGVVIGSRTVTVPGASTVEVSFDGTAPVDPGTYELKVTVRSENASRSLTVESPTTTESDDDAEDVPPVPTPGFTGGIATVALVVLALLGGWKNG